MPSGHVKWFDPKEGRGVIEHANRDHPVVAEDIEEEARVAGANVEFDLERVGSRPNQVQRAVDVRLIEGTRTSKRQNRYGDLVGAKHPDEKRPRRNRPPQDVTSPPRDE